MREVQTEEFVACIEARHKHSHISLCSGVWLYISPFGSEYLFYTVDSQLLAHIHYLAAAVITFAGVAFGILVGHNTSHSLHHLLANEVFGGDKLYTVQLTVAFLLD